MLVPSQQRVVVHGAGQNREAGMASSIYWAAGLALGLGQGCTYAVEQLCPGGKTVLAKFGLGAATQVRTRMN